MTMAEAVTGIKSKAESLPVQESESSSRVRGIPILVNTYLRDKIFIVAFPLKLNHHEVEFQTLAWFGQREPLIKSILYKDRGTPVFDGNGFEWGKGVD